MLFFREVLTDFQKSVITFVSQKPAAVAPPLGDNLHIVSVIISVSFFKGRTLSSGM